MRAMHKFVVRFYEVFHKILFKPHSVAKLIGTARLESLFV